MIAQSRDSLSLSNANTVDCIALGSPHFSVEECRALLNLLSGRKTRIPIYLCTGRHVLDALTPTGEDTALSNLGVEFVIDTCVVVTLTNSAKFAHYAKGNTGHDPVFGSLGECVESAIEGRLVRDAALWR